MNRQIPTKVKQSVLCFHIYFLQFPLLGNKEIYIIYIDINKIDWFRYRFYIVVSLYLGVGFHSRPSWSEPSPLYCRLSQHASWMQFLHLSGDRCESGDQGKTWKIRGRRLYIKHCRQRPNSRWCRQWIYIGHSKMDKHWAL